MDAEDKRIAHMDVCRKMGIDIRTPNINVSGNDFTPSGKSILYGLSSIKGVGEAAIPEIIANAPYDNIQDCIDRISKKAFNKRVAESLIRAGAFDWLKTNRYELLNELHTIRKDKVRNEETGEKEIVWDDPVDYDENACMEMEESTLGAHLTYHTWWEDVKEGQVVSFTASIKSMREHTDSKGHLMAFVNLHSDGVDLEGVVFASKYSKMASVFYEREGRYARISGKKSEKGSIIINEAMPEKSVLDNDAA